MAAGSKPGEHRGGRKPGTPNKASAAREAEVAASGVTPLEVMVFFDLAGRYVGKECRDPDNPLNAVTDADRAQVILAVLAEKPKLLDQILKQLT